MNGYVRFLVGCLLAAVSFAAIAGGNNGAIASVVTFIPAQGKMQELVTVELVRSGGEDKLYKAVEKAVLSSGWRQEKKGDYYQIPGKCTVEEIDGQYAVDCWLIHTGGQDVLAQKVKTCEEVVQTVKAFSRLRAFRKSPRMGPGVEV